MMLIEWIVSVAAGIWEWVGSLVPDWEMPAELADPNGALASIMGLGSGLGPFVDWAFVGFVGAIPLAVWVAGISWKAFRTGASHIPGFGGAG